MTGRSLSAYLLEMNAAQASVPTPQETTARLDRLDPVTPREGVVEALRRTRDER